LNYLVDNNNNQPTAINATWKSNDEGLNCDALGMNWWVVYETIGSSAPTTSPPWYANSTVAVACLSRLLSRANVNVNPPTTTHPKFNIIVVSTIVSNAAY
jgi:hypothetical protein